MQLGTTTAVHTAEHSVFSGSWRTGLTSEDEFTCVSDLLSYTQRYTRP